MLVGGLTSSAGWGPQATFGSSFMISDAAQFTVRIRKSGLPRCVLHCVIAVLAVLHALLFCGEVSDAVVGIAFWQQGPCSSA